MPPTLKRLSPPLAVIISGNPNIHNDAGQKLLCIFPPLLVMWYIKKCHLVGKVNYSIIFKNMSLEKLKHFEYSY